MTTPPAQPKPPHCLAQMPVPLGDHFPPTCHETRGHCGPHRTKWIAYAGKPFLRDLWIEAVPMQDCRKAAA